MTISESIEMALRQDPHIAPARFWFAVGCVVAVLTRTHEAPDILTNLVLANRGEPPDTAAAVVALKEFKARRESLGRAAAGGR